MSFCKNGAIRCDWCGHFGKIVDSRTTFGCPDPEYPEPYDPEDVCERCYPKFETEWLEALANNHRAGDWMKSNAEQKAAKQLGLVWVGGNGLGKWGTPSYRHNEYVTKDEFKELSEVSA